MGLGVCVSRLGNSNQQKASPFLFLQVSNLHNSQRNEYNKVFKRISMVSKTKCSGVKPNKLPHKTEKVGPIVSSVHSQNEICCSCHYLKTASLISRPDVNIGPQVAPEFLSPHRSSCLSVVSQQVSLQRKAYKMHSIDYIPVSTIHLVFHFLVSAVIC